MDISVLQYNQPQRLLEALMNESQRDSQFRGHGNADWALTPSLFRADKLGRMVEFSSDEFQSKATIDQIKHIHNKTSHHFDEAIRLFYQTCLERGISLPTISNVLHARLTSMPRPIEMMSVNKGDGPGAEVEEWAIIAMMQHYGFHTPLLDWSKNPLVALFFATEEHNGADGCVWQLNQNILKLMPVISNIGLATATFGNQAALDRGTISKAGASDCGVYFDRPQFSVNERIIAQDGWLSYSAFNSKNNRGDIENDFLEPLDAFDLQKIIRRYTRHALQHQASEAFSTQMGGWHMKKYVFPASIKKEIRKMLQQYRVDSLSVYPGLTRITDHIRELLDQRTSDDTKTSYF